MGPSGRAPEFLFPVKGPSAHCCPPLPVAGGAWWAPAGLYSKDTRAVPSPAFCLSCGAEPGGGGGRSRSL